MNKIFTILILSVLAFFNIMAQPCINWQQLLGTQENENALDAKVHPNNNSYWVVGFNNTENNINTNITANGWLLQFNLDGTLEEDYSFGIEDEEIFNALDFLNNDIVVGGHTSEIDTAYYGGMAPSNFWVNRIDENGNLIWDLHFGGLGEDKIIDVATSNSAIYFTGNSNSAYQNYFDNYGDDDLIVGKIDESGNLVWIKNYGGSDEDKGNNIHVVGNSLFVLGQTKSSNNDVSNNIGSRDYWLLEIDAITGAIIREKTFGGTAGDVGLEMVALNNNQWAIIGESLSSNGDVSSTIGSGDFWVLKIDAAWNVLWDKTFGGSSADFPQSIAKNGNNEILITGSTLSEDNNITTAFGFIDTWVAKLNEQDGSIIWDQSIGGNDLDFATRILTHENEILIAGFTDSPSIECARQAHEFHDLWFFSLKEQVININDEQLSNDYEVLTNSNSIIINNPSNQNLIINLISLDGKMLWNKSITNSIEIPSYNYPNGIYILNVQSHNMVTSHKLILGQ